MKKLLITIFCLVLLTAQLQAGVIDVRFADPVLNGDEFAVTVQVKAQDNAFELGSATVFFNYNANAITSPSYQSVRFNDTYKCSNNNLTAVYKNNFNFLETQAKGEGNYAILLNAPDQGCPSVTTAEWVDVVRFTFKVKDATQSPSLSVNTDYTAFNTVDNSGRTQHTLGNIEYLNGALTTITSSELIDVENNISIFPNYTDNAVNVSYQVAQPGVLNITVFDMMGRRVLETSENATPGISIKKIDLGSFGNGYYLIEVSKDGAKVSEKVLLTK